MPVFDRSVTDAAAGQREVKLTTVGRRSGKPHRVTIWISTDGEHLYVRSGGGLKRQWPQNLIERGEAKLDLGGMSVMVRPRHVTDPEEARAISGLVRKKYGSFVRPSEPGEPLTPGEQATFELLPAGPSKS